jgi:hypothetical protein
MWGNWVSLGGILTSGPAAVAWADGLESMSSLEELIWPCTINGSPAHGVVGKVLVVVLEVDLQYPHGVLTDSTASLEELTMLYGINGGIMVGVIGKVSKVSLAVNPLLSLDQETESMSSLEELTMPYGKEAGMETPGLTGNQSLLVLLLVPVLLLFNQIDWTFSGKEQMVLLRKRLARMMSGVYFKYNQ